MRGQVGHFFTHLLRKEFLFEILINFFLHCEPDTVLYWTKIAQMIRNEVDFNSIFPLLSYKLDITDFVVFCLVTHFPTLLWILCLYFGNYKYFPDCYLFPPNSTCLEHCCLLIICLVIVERVWPLQEQSVNDHVTKVEHWLGHKSTNCNSVLSPLLTSSK